MLNRLAQEVAAVCRRRPLEEKILIVPNRVIGHEIVAAIAASGQAVFNLRVESARSLAEALAADGMAREGLRAVSRAEQMALVESAADGAREYFDAIRQRPGFHAAAAALIEELAGAGLDPGAVRIPGSTEKERDIAAIGRAYRDGLRRSRLIDHSELLGRAREAARPGGAWVLVPRHPRLRDAERRLAEAAAGERLLVLDSDETEPESGLVVELARAASAEEEIRRAIGRLADEGAALDGAELVYAAAEYRPLAFEVLEELGLPGTFAEGVPVFYTRPGRAALGLLRWMERDFEGETLAALAEAGDAEIRGNSAVTGAEVARTLRRAQVRWGRQAYGPALSEPGARGEKVASTVQDWAGALLGPAAGLDPHGNCAPSDEARALAAMLDLAAPVRDELDGAAATALGRALAEVAGIPRHARPFAESSALVAEIVRAISVASRGPAPGRLHVAPVSSAGYSGRERTFLVGLDASVVPGRPREDPLLSDREREQINSAHGCELALRNDRAREDRDEIGGFLARLRGSVEISYPGRDAVDGSPRFPSPLLLRRFRAVGGPADAGYGELADALAAGAKRREPLSESEWWIERIRRNESEPARVEEAFDAVRPLLAHGLAAERARAGTAFTEYDGWVPSARGALDPRSGTPISPSSIEAFAACPFRWFVREGLGVEARETFERDERLWLDPRAFGTIVHDLLRDFMEGLAREGRLSSPEDLDRLRAAARARLDETRRRIPPPGEGAELRLRRRLDRICAAFLRLESAQPPDRRPAAFETRLGPGGSRSEFSSPRPVPVALAAGGSFPLVGRVDRVDVLPDGSFRVVDYKTGRLRKDAKRAGLDAGRRVQPALYALALEELSGLRAAEAVYFYLGAGGEGFVSNFGPGSRAELPGLLDAIFDAMSSGVYPHTPDPRGCPGCELEAVCGGPRAFLRAAGKLDAGQAGVLEPVLRLASPRPEAGG